MTVLKKSKLSRFISSTIRFCLCTPIAAHAASDFDNVLDMSLADLLSMEITSVSKKVNS